jgi:DNA-binding CsgD family transcriptional regulator
MKNIRAGGPPQHSRTRESRTIIQPTVTKTQGSAASTERKTRDRSCGLLPDRAMTAHEKILKLTDRQRSCLELVAMGFTSKEIGRKLGISHSTVDNHILIATQMLGVADRREAGRLVAHAGQQLPRQAIDLPEPENSAILERREANPTAAGNVRLLPPVGGQLNEQTLGHKTIQILSIALLSTMAVISLALIVSGAFKAFS